MSLAQNHKLTMVINSNSLYTKYSQTVDMEQRDSKITTTLDKLSR